MNGHSTRLAVAGHGACAIYFMASIREEAEILCVRSGRDPSRRSTVILKADDSLNTVFVCVGQRQLAIQRIPGMLLGSREG